MKRAGFAAMLVWAMCALAQQTGRPEVVAFLTEDFPVAFSADGQYLVSLFPYNLNQRQTVQLRRVRDANLEVEQEYVLPQGKYLLGVSPDAKQLVVSGLSRCWRNQSGYTPDSVGRLEVIEFSSGQVLKQFEGLHLCGMTYPVFSPDQTLLAIPNRQGYVELWSDKGKQRVLRVLGEIEVVSFSPKGDLLAVCGDQLGVYRVKDGQRVLRLDKDQEAASTCRDAAPAFTPDGTGLLVADGRKPVGLWNLQTGRLIRSFKPRANQPAQRVAVSANGRFVVMVDKGQGLAVYSASTGKMLYQTARGGYGLIAPSSLEYFATANRPKLWRLR